MSSGPKSSRIRKKDHSKNRTSTTQGCQPRDCSVEDIQSFLNRNAITLATTNVSVSGKPPLQSSSTVRTQSAGGQPPARPSPTNTVTTTNVSGEPPLQPSSTVNSQSDGDQPPARPSPPTNTVATTNVSRQPPLQPSSTVSAQTARGQPPARPSPTNTVMNGPLPSPEAPQIIAYVHNISPLKRNKKNTIDYTTLTLQTDAFTTQPALCYSKAKRKILDEHETKRAPIKITRYTKSADKTKIVINDKTLLTKPDQMDYTFQYCDDSDQPVTPLSDLLTENASKEDNITVCAKVVKVSAPKNVVTRQSRANKVSEMILLDNTGTMMLDLWNEQISQVQIDCVYRFTSLSTSYWNNSKKLTSTVNTAIKQTFQAELCSLQFNQSDPTQMENEHTIHVPMISTVEEVQRNKTCCNCNKRIIQLESIVVKCNYCSHTMRASNCSTKLYVNVNVQIDDQSKTLTIFDHTLKATLGEFDHQSIDTEHITQQLLFLENISITYNDRNVITTMQVT